jgi:putative chitinase
MNADQMRKIMRSSAGRVDIFAQPLIAAMQEFGITTARRQAAFIAQVAHESGELRYTRELATGDAYEPPSDKAVDLGNTQPGDGPLFKGRGLLQVTGRANYAACGRALGLPLIAMPTLLEVPSGASRSAAWFWDSKGLNELADGDKFFSVTHRINGGYSHGDERLAYYIAARKELGL